MIKWLASTLSTPAPMSLVLSLLFSSVLGAVERVDYTEDPSYWDDVELDIAPLNQLNLEAELGLLMSATGFGSWVNFYQYLNHYFQVGQGFQFYRQEEGQESAQSIHSGIEGSMRLTPFRAYKFSPYLRAAIGYDTWKHADGSFQGGKASYEFGMNIYLSTFFGIVISHQEISYLNEFPTEYWGRAVESRNIPHDSVMLTFRVDDRML